MNRKLQRTLPDYKNIEQEYKDFILKDKHPCIMAKTVFTMDKFFIKIYEDLDNPDSHTNLMADLEAYIQQYDFQSNEFQSFLAVFPNDIISNESSFEKELWRFLQSLHKIDDCPWDKTVSKNPKDSNFSFSLKGKAFYIVGLHPKSSRIARQAPYTTVVFNLHWQFERLREMGTYQAVKKRIRARDKKLQGSINPVLKDFGRQSEALQYSGKQTDNEWRCPFHPKPESI